MVKHTSVKFSAASVAKGSVVLSKAGEENIALEGEISRLRHHISVLSRRLHSVTLEKNDFESLSRELQAREVTEREREPLGDVVAEEVEVAGGRGVIPPTMTAGCGVVAGLISKNY